MNQTKVKIRKANINTSACVACGCCIKVCPQNAISIVKGIWAQVNEETCVGCGRCAAECPASVIAMKEA